MHPIILNQGYQESVLHLTQDSRRQSRPSEASRLRMELTSAPTNKMCVAATQSRKHSCSVTKLTTVTIVAAYLVSLASAFSHPQHLKGVTLMPLGGTRKVSKWSDCSINSLPSFSSRAKTLLSAKTKLSTGSSKSEQMEWKAVFLALQLYKAAYGDLKVPAKFVVPSAAPWPGMYKKNRKRKQTLYSLPEFRYDTTLFLISL